MTHLVVVTGPDGAGKSSVCELLTKEIAGSVTIDLWGGLHNSPFATSKVAIHEFLKTMDPVSRALLISACFSRALRCALESAPACILADGYWFKYAVSELALSGDSTLMKIADTVFVQPSQVFFLDVKPEEALARKRQFSHYESGFSDETHHKAFLAFQNRVYDKWQTMLSLNPSWHKIETHFYTPATICAEILKTYSKSTNHNLA